MNTRPGVISNNTGPNGRGNLLLNGYKGNNKIYYNPYEPKLIIDTDDINNRLNISSSMGINSLTGPIFIKWCWCSYNEFT